MTKYISMTFSTDNHKKASIRVKDLKEIVTDEEVKAVMDAISNSKAFVTSAGRFVEKENAKLVVIDEQPFVLT